MGARFNTPSQISRSCLVTCQSRLIRGAPGEQAITTSCPVTLAATMDLGAWEDTGEASEDENKIQRDTSPYPQLPMGYDQTCFGIEEGPNTTPLDAPPDACASSDATAEHMRALLSTTSLLTVQVMRRRPCLAWVLQNLELWGIYSNAHPCIPGLSVAPSAPTGRGF